MRKLLTAFLFTAFYLLVCACRPAHAAPEGLELPDYLKPLPRHLFVGETRGTVEAPALFLQLVRAYLRDNPRLVVALEWDPTEQEALNRFMADAKVPAEVAEQRLLRERSWRGYMGRVDGRASTAMLQVLRELRANAHQQHNGYPKLVAFSAGTDEHAARLIQRATMRDLGANLIVLASRAHAMKTPAPHRPEQKPLPAFFPDKTFSLEVLAREGTAWACGRGCGAMPISPPTNVPSCAQDCFNHLPPGSDFDAQYVLMRATASPPAAHAGKK